MQSKLISTDTYLLLVDEEVEIKAGSYYITNLGNIYKETERPFEEDEGAERFSNRSLYKPIIAYYPLNSEAEELDLPLLPSFEEIDVEELAEQHLQKWRGLNNVHLSNRIHAARCKNDFISGYEAAQQSNKQFNLEDMKKALNMLSDSYKKGYHRESDTDFQEADKIIQSLSIQQLPSEFIPEIIIINQDYRFNEGQREELKTITNSEGKEELVGTYR